MNGCKLAGRKKEKRGESREAETLTFWEVKTSSQVCSELLLFWVLSFRLLKTECLGLATSLVNRIADMIGWKQPGNFQNSVATISVFLGWEVISWIQTNCYCRLRPPIIRARGLAVAQPYQYLVREEAELRRAAQLVSVPLAPCRFEHQPSWHHAGVL
jgi:hypothetical protein